MEAKLQQQIRIALGAHKNVRVFRNQTGAGHTLDGRYIQFGLCVGGSDLIGWVSKEITQDMVGKHVAVFTAIEVKSGSGRASKEQLAFIEKVRLDGGLAGVAREVGDALKIAL